ncbi:WYL superfamily protein [Psychroflexus torquis ATCC 700755]|uniref:WYL superfamily protein n=1 Tax=Psychroflexus torquis (strain ATCC 700755 / CIP 106069 / ACAM 623) TaxID=313595 RepID=K4IBB6_PSYTT|nr:WYL domain-containing protein [Psychroflexus torquis]AFU67897.1 WYL superfamily protein [Psychroflexus torquis ATCC 700755]
MPSLSYPFLERLAYIRNFGLNKYKSKEEFIEFLYSKEIDISQRTLNRDFDSLKIFGFSVVYESQRKGHIITDEYADEKNLLDRYIELTTLKSFKENYSDYYQKYVIDHESKSEGVDLITDIFHALDKDLSIKFDYQKFNNEFSNREVCPLQMKVSQNRWYILGLDIDQDAFRAFGLDRIKKLEIGSEFNPKEIDESVFEDLKIQKFCLGVTKPIFDEKKREEIVLEVSDFLIEYWKSKPIHFTQDVTGSRENGFNTVKFILIPNLDLIKLIVSSLGEIKLTKPRTLKDYISSNYSDALRSVYE